MELRPDVEGDIPTLCPNDTTSFDKKGNPITTHFGTGLKGRVCLVVNYVFSFDSEGQKIQTIPDDSGYKEVYNFYKSGTIEKSRFFDEKGIMYSKTVYTYNDQNNIVSAMEFTNTNRIVAKVKYRYNTKNNLIEEDFIDH